MKFLIVIIGPTAIGKTNLSIQLARHYQCEIVSADSRQFYRGMTIGTAVPSHDELCAAPHHLIHNKEITDIYTVGDYEREAIAIIEQLHKNNDLAILVGGSGLYVDAILKGIDSFPDVEPEIRSQVRNHYEQSGIEWLQNELKFRDPDYALQVDMQNPQRLMRALEVCIGSDQPYSSFLTNAARSRNFTPVIIGLDAERAEMYNRINLRVDLMMADGLLEEARGLFPHRHLNALQTVGYRELFEYFDNHIDLNSAIEEIKKNTRRFAKRQMTWFRRTAHAHWFHYKTPTEEIISAINNLISKEKSDAGL
jgi:tRNA dimethylallyltransferase